MPWVWMHCYIVLFSGLLVNAVVFSGKSVVFFMQHVHRAADCTVSIASFNPYKPNVLFMGHRQTAL